MKAIVLAASCGLLLSFSISPVYAEPLEADPEDRSASGDGNARPPTGRVVLVDPMGDGGFESGATFEANGWTKKDSVLDTKNWWGVGMSAPHFGERSAFVSADTGKSWGYEPLTFFSSTIHFYRDVTFPADRPVITMSCRTLGSVGASGMRLYFRVVSTSTDPAAGSDIADSLREVDYELPSDRDDWTLVTRSLPSSLAGTTKRIVFTWYYDGGDTSNYPNPHVVDDISITADTIRPLSGKYGLNNTMPSSDSNAASLGEAVMWLSFNPIVGPVIFEAPAGLTFSESAPPLTATGTKSAPITIRKGGEGDDPVLTGSGNDQAPAILSIQGTDFFTFEGFGLRTTVSLRNALLIMPASPTDGASDNTFSNLTISGDSGASPAAIEQCYNPEAPPSTQEGANNRNRYDNVLALFFRAFHIDDEVAIMRLFGDPSFPDEASVVSGLTIRDVQGEATNGISGFRAENQKDLTMINPRLENFNLSYGTHVHGISFANFNADLVDPRVSDISSSTGAAIALVSRGSTSFSMHGGSFNGISGYTTAAGIDVRDAGTVTIDSATLAQIRKLPGGEGDAYGITLANASDASIGYTDVSGIQGGDGSATGVEITDVDTARLIEDRVAELESDVKSARGASVKRVVSLQISGFVMEQVLFWDDGAGVDIEQSKSVEIVGSLIRRLEKQFGSPPGKVDGLRLYDIDELTVKFGQISDLRIGNPSGDTANGVNAANVRRSWYLSNEFVYRLLNGDATSANHNAIRHSLSSSLTGTAAATGIPDTITIDFNTMVMDVDGPLARTSCLSLGDPNAVVMLRNNILANLSPPGFQGHYAVVADSVAGAAGSVFDRNVYYIANEENGFAGRIGATDYKTLADWQSATGQDANSFPHDPKFVSDADFHIDPSLPSPVSGNGSFFGGAITGVTTDLDGDLRDTLAPDIGADEGAFTSLFADDVQPLAILVPTDGTVKPIGDPFTPSATFYNAGLNDQADVAVRARITGPAPSSAEVYNETTTVAQLGAGAFPDTASFPGTSLAEPGFYTVTVSTELPGDGFAANDDITATLEISGPVQAGTYTVGPDEPAPFNTLSGVIDRLNILGIAGPVVICLTPGTYSEGEEFPITLGPLAGSSPANTVTIKPCGGPFAAAAQPGTPQADLTAGDEAAAGVTITGSSPSSIIKFQDVSYVTLDGSFDGGTDRNLSIINTNATFGTGGVWLASTDTSGGCTNITVKNTRVSLGLDSRLFALTTIGIGVGGPNLNTLTFTNAFGNDSNTIRNNVVTKARFGIFVNGASTDPGEGNAILDNVVGPTAFGSDEIGMAGIVVRHQDNATIDGNVVRFVGGDLANTSAGADRIGIGLGSNSWPAFSSTVTNSSVTGNLIHDIVDERGFSAVGIVMGGTGTGIPATSNNLVANNFIHDVRTNGASGRHAAGIAIRYGAGDRVVFNTIRMDGDLDPPGTSSATHGATGVRIYSSATATDLTMADNIISMDVTSDDAGVHHFAIVAPSAGYSWGTGGADYNDYFADTSGNPQMVLGGYGTAVPYTDVTTLPGWRALFDGAQDSHSVATEAYFLSPQNLHLVEPSASDTALRGTPVAGVTGDFDGDTRDGAGPFMGADEPSGALPSVMLTSFTGDFEGAAIDVLLNWSTFGEVRNSGFFIQRRTPADTAFGDLPGNFVPGGGTTSSPAEYALVDSSLPVTGTYEYRLRGIDSSSTVTDLDTVTVEVGATTVATVGIDVQASWNMISLPVLPENPRRDSLFPTAISSAFGYFPPPTGYSSRESLDVGGGYWLKFPSGQTAVVSGAGITLDTIQVFGGWNMIGSISWPALTADLQPLPPVTLLSSVFGYQAPGGYFAADTLAPGGGYWLKVSQPGMIVVPSAILSIQPPVVAGRQPASETGQGRIAEKIPIRSITFTEAGGQERVLHFSENPVTDAGRYELPPLPPADVFDVRYDDMRTLAAPSGDRPVVHAVLINGGKTPISIRWELPDAAKVAVLSVGDDRIPLSGSGSISLGTGRENSAGRLSSVSLRLAPRTVKEVPATFRLYQNYPNPFNPVTTIRYDLPEPGHVKISVFNTLGQEVAVPVDGGREAGYHAVSFDARDLPSGMYLYRITAGPFSDAKKLMLLK